MFDFEIGSASVWPGALRPTHTARRANQSATTGIPSASAPRRVTVADHTSAASREHARDQSDMQQVLWVCGAQRLQRQLATNAAYAGRRRVVARARSC